MIELDTIDSIEVIKGFNARFIHTSAMTLGYWDVEKGSVLPNHSHMHEQVTQVEDGEFQLTVNGDTRTYTKGMVAVIPPYVEHGGIALTDCRLFDIFQPVREDYKSLRPL
ncbi:MAG: cupin domain-containing protein [Pedobacter sp.]|nr:MAG: cupin domain-containing protein [Pedobacter sp.]